MNLSMRQLKAVIGIARFKSFTRAAEYLHISQQGLSLIVQEVETQLDCRLFDRTTRTVSLTPAAYQFLPVAEQALRSLETVGSTIGRMSEHAKLSLSVAATPFVTATLLLEAYSIFRQTNPDVTVNFVDATHADIPAVIESGAADVGFGASFKPTVGFEKKKIFHCELVCISNDTPNNARKRIRILPSTNWKAVRDRPLLGLPVDSPLQQLVDAHLKSAGRDTPPRMTLNHLSTVLAMAEAGFGIAIAPSFAVVAAQSMSVDVARLTEPVVPVPLYKINQRGRAHAPAEKAFVDTLLRVMKRRCDFKGK